MAAVKEKYKKHKTKGAGAGPDWTKTGSFIHKPDRGWIHPDEQLLPDAGVCYGVRVRLAHLIRLASHRQTHLLSDGDVHVV